MTRDMTSERPVIGFVGLGAMGSRMVERLISSGYDPVVYNRTLARSEKFARLGAAIAPTPADVASRADIVCGCLLDGSAVEDVYAGANGLLASTRPGQLFIEHTTFDPSLARSIADRLADSGADFLDAPVSGGPDRAALGTLTVMVGGTPASFARGLPVIRNYGAKVLHVGPTGAGLQLKLVNQILVSAHVAAAAEAIALLQRLDLPLDVAGELLNSGWAASTMLERSLDRVMRNDIDRSEATIGGLVEPLSLAAALADQAGVSLAVFSAAAAMFTRACANGDASLDLAALACAVDTDTSGV